MSNIKGTASTGDTKTTTKDNASIATSNHHQVNMRFVHNNADKYPINDRLYYSWKHMLTFLQSCGQHNITCMVHTPQGKQEVNSTKTKY